MIFCAEIGSNHKGSLSLAFEMIRQASIANPGGICKFQLGHPFPEAGFDIEVRRMRYAPMRWAHELKKFCDFHGMEFMASIFSAKGLEVAREVGMKRYKVAYRMRGDELVPIMWEDGKDMFMSGWQNEFRRQCNIYGIYCVPEYPTYPEHCILPKEFGSEPKQFYGYSSHMHGIEDALIAIARGAQYIEKHVTLDKTEESIKDNHFALSFDEFAEMVRIGRGMERLL